MSGSKKRPGEPMEIPSFFVALGVDGGDEGIAGMASHLGWMPIVFSKRSTMEKVAEIARELADRTGETIRIVRFERAEVLEEFRPGVRTS